MMHVNYEIVTLEEKIIVGKSIITTNENGKALSDIGMMWKDFFGNGVVQNIKNRKDRQIIGLYTDYEGDHTAPYRFMCAAQVTENENSELEEKIIKGGKYARFVVKGEIQKVVGEVWQAVYNSDLQRRFDSDFEVYTNDSEDMNNQTVEVYISVD
jgi:predicted transcriptional regulator YdeE